MLTRKSIKFIGIFFLIVIFFFSCGKRKSVWKGTIIEENGIKIIKNPKEPIYPDKIIKFEEDLSIGTEKGEENYLFNRPIDIDSDLEGNVYVLDFGDVTLRKFDPQGRFIKNIGCKGQGPGEFQRPSSFYLSENGRLYFVDSGTDHVLIFNLDGDYIESIFFPNISRFSTDRNEKIIMGYSSPVQGEKQELVIFYKVGIYNAKEDIMQDFYSQEQPWPNRLTGDATFLSPYMIKWVTDSADNIYVGTATQYEVSVFSMDQSLLFKFTWDFKPIPVTGEAERKLTKMLQQYRNFTDISKAKKTLEFYPVFYSFSVDEKDRLWIESYPLDGINNIREKTVYNVFSSEGKFLFSVSIDKHVSSQLIFKNGYLYSLITDKSGYIRAGRFIINE